jgi:hypothetical protein
MRSHTIVKVIVLFLLGGLVAGCAGGKESSLRERQAKAKVLFNERCKNAGEKIYRTVDNVDGIFLLKLRPNRINYGDQFVLDDPYGSDLLGDGYIISFIRGSWQANNKITNETPATFRPPLGYQYVEAVDVKDGARYRYTGHIEEPWQKDKHYLKCYTHFVLDKTLASGSPPRYGVTYDDISSHEDREFWIAGSSLKIIDLKTDEIIAERVGYMVDMGQGNTSGGRSPWLFAADNSCPSFFVTPDGRHLAPAMTMQARQADRFVEKVLKPIREEAEK